jgi:hypothetical protein
MSGPGTKARDFRSAHAKLRSDAPKALLGQEAQAETIVKSCGGKPTRIVAEMDLEAKRGYDFLLNVRGGDTVVANAGRSVFQLTFTHLDDSGRLVAMASSNGEYRDEHHISEGEKVKVWSGMLMDTRGFRITAEGIAVRKNESGVIAYVRMNAVKGISLGSFSIDPA